MKPAGWLRWGKWAFIGLSVLAIVITAVNGDGGGPAKTSRVQTAHAQQAAAIRSQRTAQIVVDTHRVELERFGQAALQPQEETDVGNVFGATSWYVPPPPPPPVKPPPPPPPTAPAMPFTYLGLYDADRGKVIMLVKGDRVYTVAVGDVIENTYRIDRMEHGMVEMTYLPLNIKQSISTGDPS